MYTQKREQDRESIFPKVNIFCKKHFLVIVGCAGPCELLYVSYVIQTLALQFAIFLLSHTHTIIRLNDTIKEIEQFRDYFILLTIENTHVRKKAECNVHRKCCTKEPLMCVSLYTFLLFSMRFCFNISHFSTGFFWISTYL